MIFDWLFGDDNDDEVQAGINKQNQLTDEAIAYKKDVQAPLVEGGKKLLEIDYTPFVDTAGEGATEGAVDARSTRNLGRSQLDAGTRGLERVRDTAVSAEDSADRELSLGRRYSNKYVEDVLGDVLGNIDDTFERRRGAVSVGQSSKGISKGSRAAVADTLLAREEADAKSEAVSKGKSAAFDAGLDRATRGIAREDANIGRDLGIGQQGVANTGTALQRSQAASNIGISAPWKPLANYAQLIQGTGLPQANVAIPQPSSSPGALATGASYLTGLGKAGAFGSSGWLTGG